MTEAPDNTGIVYILSNPAMDGYIKVGKTNGNSTADVQRRMSTLDTTGVPRAFDCEYAAVVKNYEQVEKSLHTAFGDFRVRSNREFFEGLVPFRVKAVLQLLEINEVTPGVTKEGDPNPTPPTENLIRPNEKPPRLERFKFPMAKVPIGADLEWVDDPSIHCRVMDENNHVEYEGKRYTLSGLAREIKDWSSARGSIYWLYEDETLQERRERLEREAEDEDE